MKRLKKTSRRVVVVCAICVAIVLGLVGLLHTGTAKSYMVESARQFLRDRYGIDLKLETLDFSILALRIDLGDLSLASASAPGMPPFARADRAALSVRLIDLLRGRTTLENVRLDGVEIQILQVGPGRSNLPQDLQPSQPEADLGDPSFLLSLLEVGSGSLIYENGAESLRLALPRWSLTIRGDHRSYGHRLNFEIQEPGSLTWNGRAEPVDHLVLEAGIEGGEVSLANLEIQSTGLQFKSTGTVGSTSSPNLDLQVQGLVDLQRAARFLALQEEIEGGLSLDGFVRGPMDDLRIQASGQGERVSGWGYRNVGLEAELEWTGASQELSIGSIRARFPAGSIRGEGRIVLAAGPGAGAASLAVENFDLEPLSRYLSFPVAIASTASGTADARWPELDIAMLEGGARLQLREKQASAGRSRLPLRATLSGSHSPGRSSVSIASAQLLGTRLRGSVALEQGQKLKGTLSGTLTDLEGLVDGLDRILDAEWKSTMNGIVLDSPISVEASLGGDLETPRLLARIDAPAIQAGKMGQVRIDAQAQIDPNSLSLEQATLTWAEQEIDLRGVLAFEKPDPSVRISAGIAGGSLAGIARAFGTQVPAAGILQAEAELSGTWEALAGSGRVSISNLELYGEPAESLSADLAWQGGELILKEMLLSKKAADGTEGYLRAAGSYVLDSGEVRLQTEGGNIEFAALTLPGGFPLRGNLRVSSRGTGTLERPELEAGFTLENARVGDFKLGRVEMEGKLSGSESTIRVGLPRYNIASTANIQTNYPYPSAIEIRADKTDIANLALDLGGNQALTGTLSGEVRGQVDLGKPESGSFTASIGELIVQARGREVRNAGPVRAEYRAGILDIQAADLTAEGSFISIRGSLPLLPENPPGSLQVRARSDLTTLLSFVPAELPLEAGGTLELDLDLRGGRQDMTAEGEIKLSDGSLNSLALNRPITDINATVRLDRSSIILEQATAKWTDGDLQARGEMPLGLLPFSLPIQTEVTEGPARFQASVRALPLSALVPLPEAVSGSLGISLEGEAAGLELESVAARIILDELKLNSGPYELLQTEPGIISIRDGEARLERLSLAGPKTLISASGAAGLLGDRALNLQLSGTAEAGLLAFLSGDIRAAGETSVDVRVGGTLESPGLTGALSAKNAQLSVATPPLRAENLDILLSFQPGRIRVDRFQGRLNGGNLAAGGQLEYAENDLKNIALTVTAEGVSLNFPGDLRSAVGTKLEVTSQGDLIIVGGSINIREGSYREPLEIEGELLRYLRSGQDLGLGRQRSSLLNRIRYNLTVETESPVLVDNNLARLGAEANLRVTGTYYRPVVTGRMSFEEGGQIYLNERSYYIERGTIDFVNQTKIEPSMDILTKTQVSSYEIGLQIKGTPANLSTNLSSPSDPELSEQDLLSILITGRKLDEIGGAELSVARNQVLSFVSGRLGSRISRGAERALGLSQVRIEPNLISPESDPGARLTVGQRITRDFRLIYSMDLANTQNQTWIADYNATRRFNTRALIQQDNTYRFEFRHDLRLGSGSDRSLDTPGPAPAKMNFGNLSFSGRSALPQGEVAKKFRLKPGQPYDFFKLQKSVDDLGQLYLDRGYPEARLILDRQTEGNRIDINVDINPGPRVEFIFEGFDLPGGVKNQVKASWQSGVFDAQRAEDAVLNIRKALAHEGYVQPRVDYTITADPDMGKKILFRVEPGVHFKSVTVDFKGASGVFPSRLRGIIQREDLTTELHYKPEAVVGRLTRFYRSQGHLDAEVGPLGYEMDPQAQTGRVLIPVREGPLFEYDRPQFSGNTRYPDQKLAETLALREGRPFAADLMDDSISRIQDLYWAEGYNDVVVDYEIREMPGTARIGVVFNIQENGRQQIKEIVIEGNRRSSAEFVRSKMYLAENDILDYRKVNQSRKSLYDTGAFLLVDFETVKIDESPKPIPAGGEVQRVKLVVRLREVQPYRIRYGGFYDTERGPGIIADAAARNVLGNARVLGVRGRYDGDVQELRGYFSQPYFSGIPLKTNITGFRTREVQPTFFNDRLGVSFQQEAQWKANSIISYGYRYERVHTFDKEPDPFFPFDVTVPIGRLVGSWTRDNRDDLLDASRGSFMSHGIEYAPKFLGSELRFLRYYGQFFKYQPLASPSEIPLSDGLFKSRLVYAGGLRIGLARGFGGQDVERSERFFAGGGTTIRGFSQDTVGPSDFFGDPAGGEAVFITNHELRFPTFSIVDGVAFVDIGNVYPKASDFNPFDVRASAGFGLRLRTPFLLLRLDYGFILDRRVGEGRGKFFFSIGQAF